MKDDLAFKENEMHKSEHTASGLAGGRLHGLRLLTLSLYKRDDLSTWSPLHTENRENGQKNNSGKTQGIWKFCQNTGNFAKINNREFTGKDAGYHYHFMSHEIIEILGENLFFL